MAAEMPTRARGAHPGSPPALRRLRVDVLAPGRGWPAWSALAAVLAAQLVFVAVGGSGLDLGADEALVGLSAGSPIGPMGRAYGGWEPSVWPLRVAPSRLWALAAGGSSTGAVRWPSAIAAIGVAAILIRRVRLVAGHRASILAALASCGSLAMIDRSSSAGIDWIGALAIVGALDRLLAAGPGWSMGACVGLAFLSGGLPPLAAPLLPLIVLRRPPGRGGLVGLAVPPLIAIVGWSAWALGAAPAQAWGAALTLPLTRGSAWTTGLGALAFALPVGPLAILWAFPSTRASAPSAARSLVADWLRVGGVALLAGTLIPGMAGPARAAMFAALVVAASIALDRAWAGGPSARARRTLLGLTIAAAAVAAAVAVPAGGYVAAAIAAYRPAGVALVVLAAATLAAAVASAACGSSRGAVAAWAVMAAMLKLGHAGIYSPEWNYRFSQGPWGRAVGQWVPPRWTLYTTVAWPADFGFAVGRPVRRLADPKLLEYELGRHPQLVLIHASDFDHWPAFAPRLIKLREFEDQHGGLRVLARTEGDFDLLQIGPGD